MNTNETITVLTGLLSTLVVLKEREIEVKDLIDHTKQALDKALTSLDTWIG